KWRNDMVAPIGSGAEHQRRSDHCLLRTTPATASRRGSSTPSYGPGPTTQVNARSVPIAVVSKCSNEHVQCPPTGQLDLVPVVDLMEFCRRFGGRGGIREGLALPLRRIPNALGTDDLGDSLR